MEQQAAISEQLAFIQNATTPFEVLSACRVGDGILAFSEEQKEAFRQLVKQKTPAIAYFVPASGSGSRMFEFLYEFVL